MFSFVTPLKIFISFGTFSLSASCENGHFFGCHYSRPSIAKEFLKNRHLNHKASVPILRLRTVKFFLEVARNCSYYAKDNRCNKNRRLSRFVLCPRFIKRYVVRVCEGSQSRR